MGDIKIIKIKKQKGLEDLDCQLPCPGRRGKQKPKGDVYPKNSQQAIVSAEYHKYQIL